ncbi:YdiU family protein [Cellulophaga baltica]|uniref:protein adenylyltransferase SelO n=1 Tax=Cellulophaga TaxID=104264 RepID=UPI001C06E370|nr:MULTISPECIES: YdiU family protein [Cellulophaga]MBU2995460.1 YdiU family protein [Cellulophaga baltica]MDO6766854.1 YdiU family protein [Cellulophaga sp. 1_MG-2023]
MKIDLQDTFTSELPADPNLENTRRQVAEACFSYATPKKTTKPELIHISNEMAEHLGFDATTIKTQEFLNIVTGNAIIEDSKPYAMCYGGHQFGNWAGQLGDGRAINLGEIVHNNKRWALQLKGAGETPYSRTADGLAVLRSSIREYLLSEAMQHLGIPTTRALSLSLSGDKVLRDVLYNGNPEYEKGAIVARVAPSFLRFGNFEIFSSRQDYKTLETLVNYTIKHFYPHLEQNSKDGYIQFFKEVSERTLKMIIEWQRVGFVHGVMNTDNMSILGLTIDYGPYGWLEGYEPSWTPNTTDRQHKRYRFENQPNIGLWNLYQLANALYPLIEDAEPFEEILEDYKINYATGYLKMMRNKIGLISLDDNDPELLSSLEEALQLTETDMTIFFRNLGSIHKEDSISTAIEKIHDAFYTPEDLKEDILEKWQAWFATYLQRLQQEIISDLERKTKMNAVNPKYVLRNYMAQLAIDKANEKDYSLIDTFYQLLKSPYDEQTNYEEWFAKRPDWARNKVGCSMLSCSS